MTLPTNPSDPGLTLEWSPDHAHRVPKAVASRLPTMNRTISLRLPDEMASYIEDTYMAMKPYGYASVSDFHRDAMWKWAVYCTERYLPYSRDLNAKTMGLSAVMKVAAEHDDRVAYEQSMATTDRFLGELVEQGGEFAVTKLAEIFLLLTGEIEKIPDPYWADRNRRTLAGLENFDAAVEMLREHEVWGETGLAEELRMWQVEAATEVEKEE